MDLTSEPTRTSSTPEQRRLQRKWYWYDWANSAFVTATMTVLFGPYVTSLANKAACPTQPSDEKCLTNLSVLGFGIPPGSLVPYTLTVSTIISAIVLLFVGAIADRSPRPTKLLGAFTVVGGLAATAMFFLEGDNWELAVLLVVIANLCMGASLVVYSGLMIRITPPDDRDRVSTTGWALGYLGGGIMLAASLALLSFHEAMGLSLSMTVRIIFAAAGIWWIVFAIVPVIGLKDVPSAGNAAGRQPVFSGSLKQLKRTFQELRTYPQTMRFLLAYLFFNDGIQTVIAAAAIYGALELDFSENQLFITILLVQFIAFFGAMLFGRMARSRGSKQLILLSLVLWTGVVTGAYFIPKGGFMPWLVLSVGIGIVMGGSQSLSRSLFSHLIPRGKESEFFSLYQAMERGTSWFGTFVFGLVYQLFHSYRLSIIALIIFFVVGGLLLRTVDVRRGISDVGNKVPQVI
ncbi:MFS transporter [Yimella sp. cx-51]|uniref:MFS transporter n=1 Tax=Yimella sp. cx-51 TaxID=2770551 RepID=UPI001FCBB73B|nr:MFS transporter [Yimella sp. cx-51]